MTVPVRHPIVSTADSAKHIKPHLPVFIVEIDIFPPITSGGNKNPA
ncbi:MAG: hypothetical protein ABW168_12630 [Sedimenticola sp.]